MKVFEEGYDKDYIYEKRKDVDKLNIKSPNWFKTNLDSLSKRGFVGGTLQPLLTMRGAIKFNMWKRTEGGKMIASALIERDDLMITEKKEELENGYKQLQIKKKEIIYLKMKRNKGYLYFNFNIN